METIIFVMRSRHQRDLVSMAQHVLIWDRDQYRTRKCDYLVGGVVKIDYRSTLDARGDGEMEYLFVI